LGLMIKPNPKIIPMMDAMRTNVPRFIISSSEEPVYWKYPNA